MKLSRIVALAAGVLILVAAVLLAFLNFGTVKTGALDVQFIGFSNSVPTAFISALPAHYSGFVDDWLGSGTNVARFSVMNRQYRSVLLYPYAGFYDRTNAARPRYETFLPDSPDAYGLLLRPGETAIIAVAVLPQAHPGMIRIGWTPDYRHSVPRVTEDLRTLITTRKRATFSTEWVYSEPITPMKPPYKLNQ